jgi:hypothetical protein
LRALFQTLKDGVGYLKAHEQQIISFGKTLITIGKYWLEYKGLMLLVNTAQSAYNGFMAGYLGETSAVVSATELRAASMNALAASMERVAYASELLAGASLSGAVGLGKYGIPLTGAGTAVAAEEGAAVAGAGALAGVSVIGGALLVALGSASLIALVNAFADKGKSLKLHGGGFYDSGVDNPLKGQFVDDTDKSTFTLVKPFMRSMEDTSTARMDTVYNVRRKFKQDTADFSTFANMSKLQQDMIMRSMPADKDHAPDKKKVAPAERIIPPNDRVTGQRVISYNINIKEINGIKQNTVNEGGKMEVEEVAEKMADIIESILNDSQIRAGG